MLEADIKETENVEIHSEKNTERSQTKRIMVTSVQWSDTVYNYDGTQ